MQRIRWFIPMMAAMLFVAVLVPGTSEGGHKWSGADPILTVNGEQYNVRFEWPSEYDCDILGDVQIAITVQQGAAVNFMSESTANFNGCEVTTNTQVLRVLDDNKMRVTTLLVSSEDFDVKTKVDREGLFVKEVDGKSNELYTIQVHLDNDFGSAVDPVLPDDYNSEQYTYDSHSHN